MHCKFLDHGIALGYQDVIKPCCVWQFDQSWKTTHQIHKLKLETWHQHPDVANAKQLLADDIWPSNCVHCKTIEDQGRGDSIRLGGISSYNSFSNDDITLEIRPGAVCNFACQTCWPAASSRVHNYHRLAGLLPDESDIDNKKTLSSIDIAKTENIDDFDFLLPVAHRLRSIVLLGGEPFYDKNCLKFLTWWNEHTTANLIVFTNGSCIDFSQLQSFKNPITLVFSMDAINRPAEYIRFGTDWATVWNNYLQVRQLPNVDVRVNITTSAYNFYYFSELLDSLMVDWPSVVTFGTVVEDHLKESVIPVQYRNEIINKLSQCVTKLENADIETGQKHNAINAVNAIINNLITLDFDPIGHEKLKSFIQKMDKVKQINICDYCEFTTKILNI